MIFYTLTEHCDLVTKCDQQVWLIFISTLSIGLSIFCFSYLAAKKLPHLVERAIVGVIFGLAAIVVSYYLLYEQAFLSTTPLVTVELDRGDLIVFWTAVISSSIAVTNLVYMIMSKIITHLIWIMLIALVFGGTVSFIVYKTFEPFSTQMIGRSLLP